MARDKVVVLRLTTEEQALLEAEAKRHGLGLGPWMRMICLGAVAKPKKRSK